MELNGPNRPKIAPKQYAHIQDLQADYMRAGEAYVSDPNHDTLEALVLAEKARFDYEESVGWPWRATAEQLRESLLGDL